ncbi:MAG TPA: hypothetical protein VJ844_08335 [Mucilaginibacter sp.]|nr:hypothetical protein [Mucilaginibacter sp.]
MIEKLKIFRFAICIAALMFVAKPFIGFRTFNGHHKFHISHTILVKSFTKRKTETQEEVDARAEQVHKLITNPLLFLLPVIACLLNLLLPRRLEDVVRITRKMLSDMRSCILPPWDTCLFLGKLSI